MTPPSSLIGQTVSHYRVVDRIGAGGMGVVYRAHDEQLDRDVALKVLPAGALADERARKQFRKEALSLAKLNHPNIETVYQFSTQDGIDFLAMELIPGETLSQKLRDGPLPQLEVLRLAMQLSNGLTAAHERGIIHRDLKPSNLIITPDGRLKILDFGLATLVLPESAIDLTQSDSIYSGKVSGTLPYMSPEQLRGMLLDPRSDIFAAGAVLYEMATGSRPFPHSQSVELMSAILHETPKPPTVVNPQVSPALERVITKALEKNPSSRYHTAREMYAALEGVSASRLSVPPATSVPAEQDSSSLAAPGPKPWRIAAAVGLLFVLSAGIYLGLNEKKIRTRLFGSSTETGPATPVAIKTRPSVAVLGFKNVSGRNEKAWLSTALAEMLTTELAAGEQLRTVSGEDVARMKANLSLPETDGYGNETLQKLHKSLGADVVVFGSYIVLGDGQIRLDLRLQDAQRGVNLASLSEKGSESQIDTLASQAGVQLRDKLGVAPVSPAESIAIKAALPTTPEATRLYAEGIAKLRTFDNIAARDLLLKAVLADPNFALAHSALASAYSALGYDSKALQSARNAFELSTNISREDRLLIEARYREADKEWDHAVEKYRILFGFFPDNLEYGLFLTSAQIKAGNAKDALATLESVRQLPSPLREDLRIDLKTAEAYLSLGDFAKTHNSASSSAERARQLNTKLILADSLLLSAMASESSNQLPQAMTEVEEAQKIYSAAGNRNGEAKSLEVRANILADKSDLSGALGSYREELATAREIGNRRLEASALNNMALVLKSQGDSEQARLMWKQSLLVFHDISDKSNAAEVLINLGGLSLEEGDLAAAKKTYLQAVSISQEVNDQSGVSTATTGIATVLDAQGDLTGAKTMLDRAIQIDLSSGMKTAPSDKLISLGDVLRHQGNLSLASKTYRDALSQSRESGDKSNAAYALMGLGEVALDTADLNEATKNYNEALATWIELGEKRNVAVTQLAQAKLAIEDGHSADALAPVNSALEQFRTFRSRDEELAASVVLARAFLLQGKISEATRELSAAAGPASKSQSPARKIEFAMATARVEAASGKPALATAHLKTALGDATRFGLVKHQLECRLAMEEVATRPGRSTESRARLDQLEKDAAEKGFSLIANKAAGITSL